MEGVASHEAYITGLHPPVYVVDFFFMPFFVLNNGGLDRLVSSGLRIYLPKEE